MRILSDADIRDLLDLERLVDVVAGGLIKQHRGTVERPDRPHYPVGAGLESPDPLGTALVMPAYVHGDEHFVTKLASVHEGDATRGLPTVHASIVVAEAATGRPTAMLEGTLVTGARTGCIGGAAVRELVDEPVTLGVLGAGTQARWNTRAIGAVAEVETVRIYSPSDSRTACAEELCTLGFDAVAVDSPVDAVSGANVVVTATTSADPVFPAAALSDDAVVVAVGAFTPEMQELEAAVVERASAVYADVHEEVATIGDIAEADIDPDDIVPVGALLDGDHDPPTSGPIVVESVGSAVLDAVAAGWLYTAALDEDAGTTVQL